MHLLHAQFSPSHLHTAAHCHLSVGPSPFPEHGTDIFKAYMYVSDNFLSLLSLINVKAILDLSDKRKTYLILTVVEVLP